MFQFIVTIFIRTERQCSVSASRKKQSIHAVILLSDNFIYCSKFTISEDVSCEFQLPLNHSYCGDMHMTL